MITAIVAVFIFFVPAQAQVTAAISGRNPRYLRLGNHGGASITVKSVETGAKRAASTDNEGNYRVDSLPLGATEVHVEKTGFKSVDQAWH